MAQKWNLQDIRPAGTPKQVPVQPATMPRKMHQDIAVRAPKPEPEVPKFDDSDLESIDITDGNGARRKRVFVTSLVILLILGAGFFVNVLLGGATVTVHPKVKDTFVQADFTAYTEPKVGELGYELMTLEAVGEKQVKAAGKEMVATRAEGKIVVYNTGAASQRLIKNTRFENKDGLIFRIEESIEVPAATKDSKGNPVPGSVVADVFADAVGEKYNVGAQRFTVPGLKGSEQFDTVYGESTVPFMGGFEGEKYIIDEAELQTAKQALQIELRDTLLARLKEERPAGFVVYEPSVTLTFEDLPSTEYGDALATIKQNAMLQVPLFKDTEFSRFIAEKGLVDYDNGDVLIPNPETLTFSYLSATTTITDISSYDSLEFRLMGNARIIWQYEEDALKNDLLGKKKTEATAIFGKYPSISNAQAEVRPFWETSFPESPEDIQIETVIGG